MVREEIVDFRNFCLWIWLDMYVECLYRLGEIGTTIFMAEEGTAKLPSRL